MNRVTALASACLAATLVAGCAAGSRPEGAAAITAIVHVSVVHPEPAAAAAVEPDSTIILAGNRIRAVGASATTPIPAGARVIDARGQWVIPGLVDSHVHFFQSGNLYTRPDVADFNRWMPYETEVARNAVRLPGRA